MGAIFALAQADETNILLAVNFDKTMQHSVDDVRAPILANSDQIGYGSVALVAAEMGEVACRNRLCDALDSNISAVADVSEEESCIICYSNIGDMCLMNCGHGGICRGCASTLATEKSRQCPVCRGEISRVLHVGALFFWLKSNVGVFYSSAGYDVVVDRADSESDEDTAL